MKGNKTRWNLKTTLLNQQVMIRISGWVSLCSKHANIDRDVLCVYNWGFFKNETQASVLITEYIH